MKLNDSCVTNTLAAGVYTSMTSGIIHCLRRH